MGFLTKLVVRFTQLLGLVLPFVGGAVDFRSRGPGLRWVVRALLLAGILVALYFLNQLLGPNRLVGRGPNWIKPIWLPVLFALFALLSWLAWWLWELLSREPEGTDFPDI